MYAHCYRTGEIEITCEPDLPGMICIGSGHKSELEQKLAARARRARNSETWLVPGVPEADSDEDALEAAISFTKHMKRPLPEHA
jgi:hypothetical protein